MIKANKGGQVSPVNGCDYAGGQFMPEHGEYCGCGAGRVRREVLNATNKNLAGKMEIVWFERGQCFQVWDIGNAVRPFVCRTAATFKGAEKAARTFATIY